MTVLSHLKSGEIIVKRGIEISPSGLKTNLPNETITLDAHFEMRNRGYFQDGIMKETNTYFLVIDESNYDLILKTDILGIDGSDYKILSKNKNRYDCEMELMQWQ